MSKVIVTAKDGNVIVLTDDQFGYVRVEQTVTSFTERGFALEKKQSALVFGEVNVLRGLGWRDNQEISGKIVIKESHTPFNKKNPDKDLKTAGSSGIVCTKNGRNIYRRAVYTPDMSATDELIPHDNYIPSERSLAQQVTDVQTIEMVDFSSVPTFGEEEEEN